MSKLSGFHKERKISNGSSINNSGKSQEKSFENTATPALSKVNTETGRHRKKLSKGISDMDNSWVLLNNFNRESERISSVCHKEGNIQDLKTGVNTKPLEGILPVGKLIFP